MHHDIPYIIRSFGGVTPLARLLNIKAPSIIGWRYRGRIPSKRIPQIIEAARRLDPPIQLEPNDFFDLSRHSLPSQETKVGS